MKYDISKGERVEIADETMRIFKAWASVEIPDKQGEIVSVEDLKKLMPILMDRGGLIMDRHTNRPVGKILNYEIKEKDGVPGVFITAKVFDHYELDNEIWQSIKAGEIKGLSIGGRGMVDNTKREWDEKEGKEVKRLNLSELYEISVTPNPANPEALIEAVSAAKSMPTEEIQKPFGAWRSFGHCVEDMKGKGYSEESAKRICGALQARLKSVENLTKEELEFIYRYESTEEKKMPEDKKPEEEVKPTPKQPEEDKKEKEDGLEKLTEAIAAMGSKLDKVIELLSSFAEEETTEKETEKKMKDEIKAEIMKELGVQSVPTQRPTAPQPPSKPTDDQELALKIARGEVTMTLADIEKNAKEAKLKQIRGFLDSVKGGV